MEISVTSICGECNEPEGNNTPQLSILRDGGWLVVCLDCWKAESRFTRNPSARPPKSRWRWVQQVYAFFHGYFWMPCPLCGDFFGGHEWSNRDGVEILGEIGVRQGICDRCADKRQTT